MTKLSSSVPPEGFNDRPLPSKLNRSITAAIIGVGVGLGSAGSHAASIVVTSNTDDGSLCTLREAIESVNAGEEIDNGCSNAGAAFGTNDTITFASSGSITLTNGELMVDSDVTIDASSVSGITVNGNSASRVVNIAPMVDASLNQLSLSGGSATYYGGGILVDAYASLSITDSTISSNVADSGGGIALGSGAELTVVDSDISLNTGANDGGGIYVIAYNATYVGANISLSGATLANNTATNGFGGGVGGVANNSIFTMTNTTVTYNDASTYGGGIYLGGGTNSQQTLVGGEISHNTAGSSGGGFSVFGESITLSVTDTLINGNGATKYGGGFGIYGTGLLNSQSVTLSNVRFSNNTATGNGLQSVGAALYGYRVTQSISNSTFSQNQADGFGAAIFVSESSWSLVNSHVTNNTAKGGGGGIYSYESSFTIQRSTISANQADSATLYGGGGLFVKGGNLTIQNSTFSGNSAQGPGGGLYNEATSSALLQQLTIADNQSGTSVGGIFDASGSLTLQNSIVANSTGTGDCGGGVFLDLVTIVQDGSCSASRAGDPGLLPLADNGGPTETHALDTASIARNTGDNANCLSNDQRGELRNDGRCDVGAFEEPVEDGGFIVIPINGGQKVVVVPL